ncbi:MAG: DegT/DnrJ/EryC1/StrS family aminotransferase [Lewinellaceae bacterium]|nr:DegT/DnrJ/EryC1/StrS family aminotransferase [Saprospiraceae bacterium]MCB9329704.1 DegT/DnrJ/EryC1/StrS family aminotransferase [Lewinellaceae bacterium]
MISVTKPFLPPIEEYNKYLQGIWQRNWLTNNGPLVNQLELELKEYLKLDHLVYVGNGTIALQIAFKALGIGGEVITTPFSYVATVSSLLWEGLHPVFVDIDPHSMNINPKGIEAAITANTSAILATHVYGNPCEVEKIQKIADKHGLKVIYDAAHCFGTTYKGKSIFSFGDISTTSFHATKLYHTIEGGAIITSEADLLKKVALMRNFGHTATNDFAEVGINGKNSEFHAAMGLANLKYIDPILQSRKEQWQLYHELLLDFEAKEIQLLEPEGYNYAYYPLLFPSEERLKKYIEILHVNYIFPRRYFYPSLNELPFTGIQSAPVSEDFSRRVLCLPLYYDLSPETQQMIARLLYRIQNNEPK